jgi:hypothetical protein
MFIIEFEETALISLAPFFINSSIKDSSIDYFPFSAALKVKSKGLRISIGYISSNSSRFSSYF